MTQLERYIFLIEYWQSKLISYKSMQENAENQINFYIQKRIELEQNQSKQ